MEKKTARKKQHYQGRRPLELPAEKDILALRPVYSPQGDVTQFFLTNGETKLVPLRTDAVLKSLARRRNKALELMRAWAGQITHRQVNNPLVISHKLVLAPFRAREAKVSGDTVMGFVNVAAQVHPSAALGTEAAGQGGSRQAKPLRGGRARSLQRADGLQGLRRQHAVLRIGSATVQTMWSLGTTQRHLQTAELLYQLVMRELVEDCLVSHSSIA